MKGDFNKLKRGKVMKYREILAKLAVMGLSVSMVCSAPVVTAYATEQNQVTLVMQRASSDFVIDESGCLVEYNGSDSAVVIPDGVKSIGEYIFSGSRYQKNITSIKVPSSVKYLEMYAIAGCTNLTNIELSKGLTSIGEGAFYGCSSLKSIDIPSSVTSIQDGAFCACRSLESISIPASVTSIGDWVFEETTENLTIYGEKNSYAEKYAKENNIKFVVGGQASTKPSFTDVPKTQYYYNPVLWAVEKNITNGLSATTFAPDNSCTRGQVVTFLWRAMGCPEPKTTKNPFKDVKSSEYYYKAVLWALENGVTSGVNPTTFAPDTTVTRSQFVTFLHRAEAKPSASVKNPFTDVKQDYYYDAVLWAYEKGITTGLDATTFGTESPCTRGQVVTFLYRALK